MTRPTWDQLREWQSSSRLVIGSITQLSPQPVQPIGPLLRDQGMARASAAEDPDWRRKAASAIDRLARAGEEFTAEDVAGIAGRPWRPNSMGAALRSAALRGFIEAVGYRTAKRGERHASRMLVWRGKP